MNAGGSDEPGGHIGHLVGAQQLFAQLIAGGENAIVVFVGLDQTRLYSGDFAAGETRLDLVFKLFERK